MELNQILKNNMMETLGFRERKNKSSDSKMELSMKGSGLET